MKTAVRYYTRTGNSEKLARAIAQEIGAEALSITAPLNDRVDILFLCNSVYWAGMDPKVVSFVKDNAKNIGTVFNVSTAALIKSTYSQMKKVAAEAGVNLSEKEFHCKGKFSALHKGHPDSDDLNAVRKFAKELIQ